MANTLKFGNGEWYGKKDTILAYNDENDNYKPLPFDFSRGSSATVVNKDGLIETVGSGEPRIDYKDDSKGALLLEPQRTNLATYSEDFSQWYIDGNQSSPTVISELNPDGSSQVYQINLNSGGNIYRTISISSSIDYTFSVYIKGTGNGKLILSNPQSIPENYVDFTATSEWQRIELTGSSSSTSVRVAIGSWSNSSANGTIQIYGAQLEQGSYATSYISTQGSAVTRLADTCANGGNEQVINSTEGVLYAEIAALANSGNYRFISISDGTNNNRIYLNYSNASNQIQVSILVGGVQSYGATHNLSSSIAYNKIAVKWKLNDFSLYVNGVEVSTSNSNITFPANTLNKINFSNETATIFDFEGKVKSVEVFTEALSDEELQKLTTI